MPSSVPQIHHDNTSNHTRLSPSRLEAFSDGVIAIIITITVLELKVPTGPDWQSLIPLWPLFFAYVVSFQTIGTYWNNHHHLLRATKHVSAGIMWANLHLLFWLSLIPFATGWLGENHGGAAPTALYATILLLCAIAYSILQLQVVIHSESRNDIIQEMYRNPKGLVSFICYAFAILLAFIDPVISDLLIVFVSLLWFIPDRRIERFI